MNVVNTQQDTAFSTKVVEVSTPQQWRCYDRFGPDLRRFLQEAPIDIDTAEVEEAIGLFAPGWGRAAAERFVIDLYAEEIESWKGSYRASFQAKTVPNGEFPHLR